MAYNTGNPVGSNDFRDLSDNAVNFDYFANGPEPAYPNRFNQLKLSISGMDEQFNQAQTGRQVAFEAAIAAVGYVWLGDYGAGITFTTRSQYTVRDGVPYILANATTLPYTTTGNWASEVSKFKVIDVQDILRQDLASSDPGKGVNLVYGAVRTVDSAAALEASAGRFDGETVLLRGWHADLPGIGANKVYWSAASTATADRGSIFQVTGQATGRWLTVFPEGPISAASWGLRPDLATDQIARIEAALAYCAARNRPWLRLLPATIWISLDSHGDGSGLVMPTGVYLDLSNTTLRALVTAQAGYSVLLFKETCLAGGVFGHGGKVIGERDAHTGTTGEFGMGVNVRGARNIYVGDIHISKCWGDGLYLGADTTGNQATYSKDVTVHNVTCDGNRRNGTSLTNARDVNFTGYYIGSNNTGTSPQAGIDLEPDAGGLVQNVNFAFVHCFGNTGSGFMTFNSASDPLNNPAVIGVQIDRLLSESNGQVGLQLTGVKDVTVNSLRAKSNLNKGLTVEASSDVDITLALLRDNHPTGTFQRGDATITGSNDVCINRLVSKNAIGACALIIRGCTDVEVGSSLLKSTGLTQAAVTVEVNCDSITLSKMHIHEAGSTGVYIDSSCTAVNITNPRFKNVGQNNANAGLIQNESAGALITGAQHSSSAATKPFFGVKSAGANCIVSNNNIPASMIGGGSAQAIVVTGTNSVSPNNLTTG